jgi:hypothetical protein
MFSADKQQKNYIFGVICSAATCAIILPRRVLDNSIADRDLVLAAQVSALQCFDAFPIFKTIDEAIPTERHMFSRFQSLAREKFRGLLSMRKHTLIFSCSFIGDNAMQMLASTLRKQRICNHRLPQKAPTHQSVNFLSLSLLAIDMLHKFVFPEIKNYNS